MNGAIVALLVSFSALLSTAYGAPLVMLSIGSLLSGTITQWYGVALAAAVAVIAIAALVYMLSSTLGLGAQALAWSRMQIYEAALGIVFIVLFFSFYSFMLLDPQASFSAAGLVPVTCSSANENTIYNLAACDLSTFLSVSNGMFQLLYYASYLTGSVPKLALSYTAPGTGIGLSTSVAFFPKGEEETLAIGFSFLLFMIMLNEIQMILITAAPLLFSMLLAIGIIAWILGFSRRFGGAMITFALAFGLIYPLLTSITYGYLDNELINAFNLASPGSQITGLTTILQLVGATLGALSSLVLALFSSVFGSAAGFASLGGYLLSFGYIFAGLTFIPFLDFMILESFVLDVSKVLGEQVSFMGMISSLV